MKQAILFIMLLGFIYPAGASDLVFSASSDTTWQWYCNGKLLQGETNATLKGTGSGGVFNYKRTAIVDGKVAGEFNITLNVPTSPSKPTPEPPVDTFIITNQTVLQNVVSGGITCTLHILVSQSWKVSSCPDWVTVTPSSGDVAGKLVPMEFKVSANTGSVDRSGQVVFERKDKQVRSVSVTQKGKVPVDNFLISNIANPVKQSYDGRRYYAKILSSGSWKVSSCPDWITVTPSSGEASDISKTVDIKISANQSPYIRNSQIVFERNDGQTLSVVVDQVAQFGFTLNGRFMSFMETIPVSAEGETIIVSCWGEDGVVYSLGVYGADWVELSESGAVRGDQIYITIKPNTSGSSRSTEFGATGSDLKRYSFNLNQAAQ